MKKRLLSLLLAAVMVLSMLPGMAFAASTTNEQPFPQGTLGSTNFRIPAIVTLDNGTLVAAADARWSTSNDGGGIDTMIAISRDNGATWDHTWGAYLGNNANTGKTDSSYGTFIDPALATDGKTVYLLVDLFPRGHSNLSTGLRGDAFTSEGYLRLCANKSESETDYTYYLGSFDSNADETAQRAKIFDSSNNAVSGYTVDRWFNLYTVDETGAETKVSNLFYSDAAYWAYPINYLYLTKSTDGGATWSAPSLLDFKENGEIFYGVCPGGATVTADGTIIFPCYGCEAIGSNLRASYIYSTDGGNTWARSWSRSTQTFANKSSEASITQAKVGDKTYLYAFMRYYPTNTSGAYYVSEDNGNTWKAMTDVTYSCGGALGTVTYSKTINGKPAILVSSPSSTSNANGRIYVFTVNGDGSLENEFTYVVNNSYYKYSDMTELSDGSIGLLYESAGAAITFAKLDIATIAPGATIGGSDTTDPDQPDIPVEPEDTTVTDADTGVTVTAPGLTSVTVRYAAAPEIAYAEPGKVVAYDISPVTGTGNYIGEATVTFARPDDWTDSDRIQGFVMKDGLLEKMDTSVNDDTVSVKFEHFSVGGIYYAADATAETPVEEIPITITISVGETKTETIPNVNYGSNVSQEGLNTDVATVEVKGNNASNTPNMATTLTDGTYIIGDGTNWLKLSGTTLSNTTNPADATKWTITTSDTSYTIKSGSYYLGRSGSNLSATSWQTTWNYNSSSGFYYMQGKNTYYYLQCNSNNWSVGTADSSNGYAYSYDLVPASTTVTITGVSPGETSVTVGSTVYKIIVEAKEITKTVSVQCNNRIILDAVAALGLSGSGYSVIYSRTSGDSLIDLSNDTVIAKSTEGTAMVTATVTKNGKTVGTVRYTIEVVNVPVSTSNTKITSADAVTINGTIISKGALVTGLMLSYSANGCGTTSFKVDAIGVVSWSSLDKSVATVADDGTITATGIGETYVIARFTDGTQTVIPVRVVYGETNDSRKDNRYGFYIDGLYHTDLFYAICSGATVDLTWTQISEGYLIYTNLCSNYSSAETSRQYGGVFFATRPEDGYATTYMGHARNDTLLNNLYYNYIGRSGDSDKPWNSGVEQSGGTYIYFYAYATYKQTLATKGYTEGEFEELLKSGIKENNLDAACFYTYSGRSVGASMQFISDKLPTFDKEITSVTRNGENITYSNGMEIESGDTINYAIKITTYKPHATTFSASAGNNSYGTYGSIGYSNVTLTDELTGLTNDVNVTEYMTNSSSNAGTFRAEPGDVVQATKTYSTSFTLNDDTFNKVVNGVLTNTAQLNYTYDAVYSIGSVTASAEAEAHCKVKTLTFVIDFGLPVEIDLSAVLGEVEISDANSSCSAQCTTDGTQLTYKPISTIAAQGDYVSLNLHNDQHYGVTILPASNVLYEEDFMEMETSGTDVSWEKLGTPVNATQSSENAARYGYDAAYASSTGSSGSYYVANLTSSNRFANNLTFTFTGTGFDLIGACGSSTGTLMATVYDSKGQYVKGYLVDTAFKDADVADKLYQVPIVHAEGLDKDTYTVKISGAYIVYNTNAASAASMTGSYSAFFAADPVDTIYELGYAMGLSDAQIEELEFINMDALYGAATVDVAGSATATAPEQMTLEIDAFRVYTDSNNEAYADGEKGMVYYNALDKLNADEITAYVESGTGTYDKTEYEAKGGPQNEIYLAPGQSVAFKVDTNNQVQISLRSVTGVSLSVNNKTIAHATEMYYWVTPDNGIVTITNGSSNTTDLLGIGNIKVPGSVAVSAISEEDAPVVFSLLSSGGSRISAYTASAEPETPAEPEVPAYEPFVKVNVKSVNVIRNKLVTLTITTSTDVETLTVNGKTLKPTNSWMVKMGWSDTYTYVYVDTVRRGTTADYEIIATNSDGLSCTYSAQG